MNKHYKTEMTNKSVNRWLPESKEMKEMSKGN